VPGVVWTATLDGIQKHPHAATVATAANAAPGLARPASRLQAGSRMWHVCGATSMTRPSNDAQGIHARWLKGLTVGPELEATGEAVPDLVGAAFEMAIAAGKNEQKLATHEDQREVVDVPLRGAICARTNPLPNSPSV
jgi:hypothetical protein